MKSKDQTSLKIFHVKESKSNNLIDRENSGVKTQEPDC